jgi:hypothetical protein
MAQRDAIDERHLGAARIAGGEQPAGISGPCDMAGPAQRVDLLRRLSRATLERLEVLAETLDGGDMTKRRQRVKDRPITGTRLIREWQGVEHCVMVLDDGFEYQGRPYRSLSAIARAITGTRWNGLIFFGLKNQRGSK